MKALAERINTLAPGPALWSYMRKPFAHYPMWLWERGATNSTAKKRNCFEQKLKHWCFLTKGCQTTEEILSAAPPAWFSHCVKLSRQWRHTQTPDERFDVLRRLWDHMELLVSALRSYDWIDKYKQALGTLTQLETTTKHPDSWWQMSSLYQTPNQELKHPGVIQENCHLSLFTVEELKQTDMLFGCFPFQGTLIYCYSCKFPSGA